MPAELSNTLMDVNRELNQALDFYEVLHVQQAETITRLQGELDEAKKGEWSWAYWPELLELRHAREKQAELLTNLMNENREARTRATHAERELAAQAARVEELTYDRDSEYQRAVVAEVEHAFALQEIRRLRTEGGDKHKDMEERAVNAEYNARHYWRELQAQENRNQALARERDSLLRRVDELNKAPNLWSQVSVDGNWTLVRAGGIENGSGVSFTSKVATNG